MRNQEGEVKFVRVIGGEGDGQFAPSRSLFIDPTHKGSTDIYITRRLRVDGYTVEAMVLSTISDPDAVAIYRNHVARDPDAAMT